MRLKSESLTLETLFRQTTNHVSLVEFLRCSLASAPQRLSMSVPSKAGIQTGSDGASFIPASQRFDGSTRKEIRVRPGYQPPEDVETYRNRSAASWKNRGSLGVPGADSAPKPAEHDTKSKNARRREAARRKVAVEGNQDVELLSALERSRIAEEDKSEEDWRNVEKLTTVQATAEAEDAEHQRKIRNALKKLKAVQQLKEKRAQSEKLSHDQLMKISKESELLRDLTKLGYDGSEMVDPQPNGEG